MVEIPVQHKKGVVPLWGWLLGAALLLGTIGLIIGLRQCGYQSASEPAAVATRSGACALDNDCPEAQICASAACIPIKAGLADCAMGQVHFATDSAVLRSEDRPAVARMARCLKADQHIKLSIAGSADERGTAEHNADLGERRAIAVAQALQGLGVSAAQLSIVSYGDNYQLCQESDRECWAKNRRASLTPRQDVPAKP